MPLIFSITIIKTLFLQFRNKKDFLDCRLCLFKTFKKNILPPKNYTHYMYIKINFQKRRKVKYWNYEKKDNNTRASAKFLLTRYFFPSLRGEARNNIRRRYYRRCSYIYRYLYYGCIPLSNHNTQNVPQAVPLGDHGCRGRGEYIMDDVITFTTKRSQQRPI